MRIVSGAVPGAACLARLGPERSPNARRRLKWMEYYLSPGRNARRTCRYFGISPQTFYEVWDLPWTVMELNRKARVWEHVYNTIRPHQALGYRTPNSSSKSWPMPGQNSVTNVPNE